MYETSMALKCAHECWVDIPNYDGYYQVSNYGKVRSLDRVITEKTGKTQTLKGRILKPRINRGGYYYVGLRKNGSKATFAIHQLVAQAFLDNPENKPTVYHLNGIKTDNNVNNLEWATYSENLKHASKTGLRTSVSLEAVGEKNYKRKLKPEQVIEIKRLLAEGNLTHKEIANQFSVARSTITEIKSGRRWKHLDVTPLTIRETSYRHSRSQNAARSSLKLREACSKLQDVASLRLEEVA